MHYCDVTVKLIRSSSNMDTPISGNSSKVNDQQQLKSLLVKALICNVCNRELDVTPMLYKENIGNICGRCSSEYTAPKLGVFLEQQVYQDLIKNLTFPCINQNDGCNEVLNFGDLRIHERNCRFRTNCPVFALFPEKNICSWTGNPKLLCDHLKSHSEKFLDPPQFDWPLKGKDMVFFTTIGNEIITVAIKYEKLNKYACLVMVNGTELDGQSFMYELELTNKNNSNTIILRNNRLEHLSGFVETLWQPGKTLQVDVDKISEVLQNSEKIFAKFNIFKKNKNEIIKITGDKDGNLHSQDSSVTTTKVKNTLPDDKMLVELECPVCKEFMLPPIYICPTGHSICSKCKTQVQACPSCRYSISQGRNYTLEKLTEKMTFPCRNQEIGCSFVSTSDKMKQHQTSCNLSEHPCVLKCGWKGVTVNLFNHVRDKHRHWLIENNTTIRRNLSLVGEIGHYFLDVMGDMFCLTFKFCKTNGEWHIRYNIQHIGYFESLPKYMYTMQFSRAPKCFFPITITNVCQSYNNNLQESMWPGLVNISKDYYLWSSNYCYIKINIKKVC